MINLVEDIKPVSYLQSHTTDIIKQVEEKNTPIVITENGSAKAVLMDVKQYQNIVDTLSLIKILFIGENDTRNLRNNRIYTHEDLQKKIRSILG